MRVEAKLPGTSGACSICFIANAYEENAYEEKFENEGHGAIRWRIEVM